MQSYGWTFDGSDPSSRHTQASSLGRQPRDGPIHSCLTCPLQGYGWTFNGSDPSSSPSQASSLGSQPSDLPPRRDQFCPLQNYARKVDRSSALARAVARLTKSEGAPCPQACRMYRSPIMTTIRGQKWSSFFVFHGQCVCMSFVCMNFEGDGSDCRGDIGNKNFKNLKKLKTSLPADHNAAFQEEGPCKSWARGKVEESFQTWQEDQTQRGNKHA